MAKSDLSGLKLDFALAIRLFCSILQIDLISECYRNSFQRCITAIILSSHPLASTVLPRTNDQRKSYP